MYAGSRYSSAAICPDKCMEASLCALVTALFGPLFPPVAIQLDQAFNNDVLKDYTRHHNVDFRPSPARRQSKHLLQSKHGVIRYI